MKNLNEIDIGKLFKELIEKMGKKNAVIVGANGVAIISILIGGILINNKFQSNFSENKIKLEELQTLTSDANKEKENVETLKLKIAELKEDEYERDIAVQMTETLKEIENLMVQYSFINSVHKVKESQKIGSITTTPVEIEYIGSFANSVKFIEELNNIKLPIALRDLKFHIPEEEYADFIGTQNVKTSLTVLITDDLMNVEKKGSKVKTTNLSNPFGYHVFDKKEEPKEEEETIDAYQQYLQQFTKEKIKEEINAEQNNNENLNTGTIEGESTPLTENSTNNAQANIIEQNNSSNVPVTGSNNSY